MIVELKCLQNKLWVLEIFAKGVLAPGTERVGVGARLHWCERQFSIWKNLGGLKIFTFLEPLFTYYFLSTQVSSFSSTLSKYSTQSIPINSICTVSNTFQGIF